MSIVATPQEGPSTGEPAPGGFQQRLGLFDSTMLVAGAMIGSGIFIVSAEIARDVGAPGWLLAVWLVTGLMTVIGALLRTRRSSGRNVGIRGSGWKQALQAFTIYFEGRIPSP